MTEDGLRRAVSRVMLYGVLLAALVLLVGGGIHLWRHADEPIRDRIFRPESADLRNPLDVARAAASGDDASLIQLGVLLLLMNPVLRVALAMVAYAAGGDRLYAAISGVVLTVLVVSFFL